MHFPLCASLAAADHPLLYADRLYIVCGCVTYTESRGGPMCVYYNMPDTLRDHTSYYNALSAGTRRRRLPDERSNNIMS